MQGENLLASLVLGGFAVIGCVHAFASCRCEAPLSILLSIAFAAATNPFHRSIESSTLNDLVGLDQGDGFPQQHSVMHTIPFTTGDVAAM